MELRPYQLIGASHLADYGLPKTRKGALLADDMGLGKCAMAIRACEQCTAKSVLVLCPASVVETWKREFKKWGNQAPFLVVMSYDKAMRETDGTTGAHFDVLTHFDVLILDEAHYLKNPKAKRTQMVFGPKCDGVGGLVSLPHRVMLLTGTPMPNNPAELWPMLRAVAPLAIISPKSGKPYGFWQFVAKYCKVHNNGFSQQITGAKNHDELCAALDGFMLRRTKAEVLPELPPISFAELYIDADHELKLPENAAAEISLIRDALAKDGIDGLAKVANHVATLRRFNGMVKVKPIVDWISTWFECGGGKLVVFAYHREVLNALFKTFGRETVAMITGSTDAEKRWQEIDKFQRQDWCKLFFGQINAAGEGITLTSSSDVLFVESSWVPKDNLQAAMRVHRIGQENACMVRWAMITGSIDEDIQRTVMRKSADIAKILS